MITKKLNFYLPKTKTELVYRLHKWKGWTKSQLQSMSARQLQAIYIKERQKTA